MYPEGVTKEAGPYRPKSLPGTARSLPVSLIRAREWVMAPIRRMLADTGITEQQWRVLRVLQEYGPQDATKLAERASLMPPSLTRIVQTMEAAGFIRRDADANDRRRQTIAILPKGERLIEDNLEQALDIAAQYRRKLGNEDYERLLDLLEKLTRESEEGADGTKAP